MSWHTVRLGQVIPTPWKNGGGTTRELVAWPDTANWAWRMSAAEVAQGGPFSHFDGVERWFAVLSGAGVVLTLGGERHLLTSSTEAFCFDGAMPADCTLVSGVTQDFNVMTRRGHSRAVVRRVSEPVELILEYSKMIAIYAIKTGTSALFNGKSVKIEPASLVWRHAARGDRIELESNAALLIAIEVVASV